MARGVGLLRGHGYRSRTTISKFVVHFSYTFFSFDAENVFKSFALHLGIASVRIEVHCNKATSFLEIKRLSKASIEFIIQI